MSSMVKSILPLILLNAQAFAGISEVQLTARLLTEGAQRASFTTQQVTREVDEFKAQCQNLQEEKKLIDCLTKSARLHYKMRDLNASIPYQLKLVQELPSEMALLKNELSGQLTSFQKSVSDLEVEFSNKEENLAKSHALMMKAALQKDIATGRKKGLVGQMCVTFQSKLNYHEATLEFLGSKKASYLDFYKLSDRLREMLIAGQNIQSHCPDKIDLARASKVLTLTQKNLSPESFRRLKMQACPSLSMPLDQCLKMRPTTRFVYGLGLALKAQRGSK